MANVTLLDSVLGTYTSFSGADIVATMSVPVLSGDGRTFIFRDIPFANIQTLTVSSHRDKFPVRAFGSIGSRGFCAGPRTTAGTMIFTAFDRDAVYQAAAAIAELNRTPDLADIEWSGNSFTLRNEGDLSNSIYENMLADEMPRFNIVVTLANEYGNMSHMVIYDITVVDQGMVLSIDNIATEQTMSYMAGGIRKLQPGPFTSGTQRAINYYNNINIPSSTIRTDDSDRAS